MFAYSVHLIMIRMNRRGFLVYVMVLNAEPSNLWDVQVIEHKPYNRKADVFSFGIVLWELLTGMVRVN